MRKMLCILVVTLWFGAAQAGDAGEGLLGIDLGYSWGHFYGDHFPDAVGASLGFHYEPPLTEVLNLTVTAKYHFLYWAENKEEMMYHLPQASVGVKFLMDVYTILPFIGGGVSFNLNAYRPNDAFSKRTYYDAGIRFAPGVYFDLGADIYVSDEFGVGFNVRYDWVIDYFYSDPKIPNLLCLNMRLNFMTLN